MPSKKKRRATRRRPEVTFGGACALLEELLGGDARSRILDELGRASDFDAALARLEDAVSSYRFPLPGGATLSLERIVRRLDERTREDGFHVLHDWDGTADRFLESTIPLDVLRFYRGGRAEEPPSRTALAILLDYSLFYVLALCGLRAWDEGDPNENLDRVTALLGALEGPEGSGQRFAARAATAIFVATSHFEPDATAYDRLLGKVLALDEEHRTAFALPNAAILSSHLRFGFEATYGRDIVAMREDNAPDYPWLCASLASLLRAYDGLVASGTEGPERDRIVEAIANGLAPDPRAFLGAPPPALAPWEAERRALVELFGRHRDALLAEIERCRPSEEAYSPLALYFNFPHNVLKAIVVDALFRGAPWRVGLDELLTGVPRGGEGDEARRALVAMLLAYARSSPDRIRGRPTPVIVYDVRRARLAFRTLLANLK